jgi:hypothetical protein
VQQELEGKVLSLLLAVYTRWSSHYLSLDRLHSLRRPMVETVRRHEMEIINSVMRGCSRRADKERVLEKAMEIFSYIKVGACCFSPHSCPTFDPS